MSRWIIAAITVVLVVAWGLWAAQFWALPMLFDAVPDLPSRGQWGDSFGALNALFSAFAFSAVLITLWIQQRQINDAQRDQHRQRFDETFFKLLALLRDVRSELRYTPSSYEKPITMEGAQALQGAASDARYYLLAKKPVDRDFSAIEIGNIYSSNVHKRSEAGLGPYFRLIYTLLKRIDSETVLSADEKVAYSNLLRGQLGSPEIELLALNGLTRESKDLATYLGRFRMLKYMTAGPIRSHVERCYPPEAFAPRAD
ncbi:putative phage abortive infection protein [Mesorhizobium sp. 2RAF45]|uniref:putative phage abortive infection protein n=1 Tax=Mesorhizobium sp. 2RAF45 TaxID=3233001 RepID=UPI003F9B4429